MQYKLLFFFLLLNTVVPCFGETSTVLKSPDNKTVFRLFINEDGSMNYTVSYMGKKVVDPSALGVENWQNGLRLFATRFFSKDNWWTPV